MYKIGLSTTASRNTEELFSSCAKAGVEVVEISRPKGEVDALDYNELKSLSDKYGVKIWSFHLPFWPFSEIDISREDLAEKSIEYLCNIIDKATGIGIDKFVIHASGEPIEDEDRKGRMECAKKSLDTLAQYAKERGAIICVEDLPRSCLGRSISDICELISANDDLRVCFDTNHLLYEDNVDFVRALGDKIVTLHVSDFDMVNERHWLPGEGKNDWKSILGALKEVGYKGPWLYEIDFATPKTIIRERDLTAEDFVRNATELFEGKDFTIFSTPKPNLGYWE